MAWRTNKVIATTNYSDKEGKTRRYVGRKIQKTKQKTKQQQQQQQKITADKCNKVTWSDKSKDGDEREEI